MRSWPARVLAVVAACLLVTGCAGPGGSAPGMSVANDTSNSGGGTQPSSDSNNSSQNSSGQGGSSDSNASSQNSSKQGGSSDSNASSQNSSQQGGSSDSGGSSNSSQPGGSSGQGGSSDSQGSSQKTFGQGGFSDTTAGSSKDSYNQSEQSSGSSANSTHGSAQATQSTVDDTTGTSSSQNPASQNSSGSGTDVRAVLSTALIGTTVIVLGIAIWATLERPPKQEFVPWSAGKVTLEWLLGNAHELRVDLAFGAGPAIDDLAAAAEIPRAHLARFGRLLRAHRKELWRLAAPAHLDVARALRVLARIGQIARADPTLHADYLAFVARHGLGG